VTLEQLADTLNRGGVLVLLLLILVGGWRGWWVFGPVHREVVARLEAELARLQTERDRLFDLALNATKQAGRAVETLAVKKEL
jgi:hypothetical protein